MTRRVEHVGLLEMEEDCGLMSVRDAGGIGVITLRFGDVREHQAQLLEPNLRDAATSFGGRLVIDNRAIGNFGSAWVNTLLALSRQCTRMGGALILAGLSRPAMQFLRQSGLARSFQVADTPEQGVGMFNAPGSRQAA